MKNTLTKTVSLVFTSLFIIALHLPFVFANTASVEKVAIAPNVIIASTSTMTETSNSFNSFSELYSNLGLQVKGLSEEAFMNAMKGYNYLKEKGRIVNDNIISIVDFTRSSSQKRLFVIDLKNFKLLYNTYVAHGQGSGLEFANRFSNLPESLQSSLGFYITSDTYIGKHGYSMHLEGLEPGINDKANERAIVLHAAPYVSEDYIRSHGFIGRSWGCPALPEKLTKPIIQTIKNGSCLFIYSSNKNYLNRSGILNS
ncbi:MAG: murein L,D-transpeptidase catalytic domain family protein [Ferruginibacter sp.]